jgi:hypothetical protein
VKERRGCVKPNKGFMEQLHTYEGILNARWVFLQHLEDPVVRGADSHSPTSQMQVEFRIGE